MYFTLGTVSNITKRSRVALHSNMNKDTHAIKVLYSHALTQGTVRLTTVHS